MSKLFSGGKLLGICFSLTCKTIVSSKRRHGIDGSSCVTNSRGGYELQVSARLEGVRTGKVFFHIGCSFTISSFGTRVPLQDYFHLSSVAFEDGIHGLRASTSNDVPLSCSMRESGDGIMPESKLWGVRVKWLATGAKVKNRLVHAKQTAHVLCWILL